MLLLVYLCYRSKNSRDVQRTYMGRTEPKEWHDRLSTVDFDDFRENWDWLDDPMLYVEVDAIVSSE